MIIQYDVQSHLNTMASYEGEGDTGSEPEQDEDIPKPVRIRSSKMNEMAARLYPTGLAIEANPLLGVPFGVGHSQTIVYGNIVPMVSRSTLIEQLYEAHHVALSTATITHPVPLLVEMKGLDVIPSGFKIVWNHLNGIYQDILYDKKTGGMIWPYPNMSLDDKYMFIYYSNYFDVKDLYFVGQYLLLYINDLKSAMMANRQDKILSQRLMDLQPIIEKVIDKPMLLYIDLSGFLDEKDIHVLQYGPHPTNLPLEHKRIFVHRPPVFEHFTDEEKPYVQVFNIHKNGTLRSAGTWLVKSVDIKTASEITGIVDNSTGPKAPRTWGPSPYGFSPEDVRKYFIWANHPSAHTRFTVLTLTSSSGDFSLYDAPWKPLDTCWLAPTLASPPGSSSNPVTVHFYASHHSKLETLGNNLPSMLERLSLHGFAPLPGLSSLSPFLSLPSIN